MSIFAQPVDIVNRGLQRLGIPRITSLTEDSKQASEANACYDDLRRAELARNPWCFALRRIVLYPVSLSTMAITFPAFDAAQNYQAGAIVSSNGQLWQAPIPIAVSATTPENSTVWRSYFGVVNAELFVSDTAYYAGDIVYTPQTESFGVYLSLTSANEDDPTAIPAWDSATVYMIGDTVTFSATTWQSKKDLNVGNSPAENANWTAVSLPLNQQRGQNWLKLDATLSALRILYPAGTGPSQQSMTRNVFPLPNGFLRKANQAPKAGSVTWMGAPTGRFYDDWLIEGGFIVSTERLAIPLRFTADVTNVSEMDGLFCEGLAARIAFELCEVLTQSNAKKPAIGAEYTMWVSTARTQNGIENGPEEAEIDEWLSVRNW